MKLIKKCSFNLVNQYKSKKGDLNMKKTIVITMLVIAVMCLGVTASFAKLYSAAPYGQGTSTIGTGGDYPSIYAASLDFDTTANTGPWVMQILNSLTEVSVSCFGNYVPTSSSITLEPASGVNATVTFAETTTQCTNAVYGQFVVGLSSDTAFSITTVSNFTINGSNNGTNSINLTFLRPDNYVGVNYMFRTLGCPGFTMENCNVLNRYATETTASGATTAFTGYCFYMDIDIFSAGNDLEPDGFQFINNYIECTAGDNFYEDSRCMYIGNNQGIAYTLGVDHFPRNWVISGNTLVAGNRNVYFYRNGSGTFSNNSVLTYHHEPGDTTFAIQGGLPIGLWSGYCGGGGQGVLDANGHQATVNIYGNYFLCYDDETAAGNDNDALGLDGVDFVYNVYNNEIVMKYNNATQQCPNQGIYGIWMDVAASNAGSVINIFNNSIDIANNALLNQDTGAHYNYAIYDGDAGFNLTIENNLIRADQAGGTLAFDFYSTGSNMTTVCDYNTIFVDTTIGGVPGRLAALSDYSTYALWTTNGTGYDVHGQFLDPDAMTGHWISDVNLSFTAIPTQLLAATTATPVALTKDFFGNTRSATAPDRGAVEVPAIQYSPVPIQVHLSGSATITLSGGEPPYSLNTSALGAIGFVSSTTGSSILFTAGSIITTGTFITAYDSFGPDPPQSSLCVAPHWTLTRFLLAPRRSGSLVSL